MQKTLLKMSTLTISLGLFTCSYASFFTPSLKTDTDKISYAIGYQIGSNFKNQNITISPDNFQAGLEDGLSAKTPVMTQEDMQTTLNTFQKQMMQQAVENQMELAKTNLAASQAYLTQIAAKPGVKELTPGLYYSVITEGKGNMPGPKDMVTVNYQGTLPDGSVFDSSYKRGQPASFQVNQVIPGWTKALQKMPVGSTWMVYMSPDLAYGQYAPPQIGPNQALTFKIELISIGKPSAKISN